MASAGKLEILVMAKLDQLDADLAKVEQKVDGTNKKLSGGMAKGMQGVLASAGKLAVVFTAIDAAVTNLTMQMHQYKAVVAAMKGDWDGAGDAVKDYVNSFRDIPIIGPMLGKQADRISGLILELNGTAEKMRELEAIQKRMAATKPFQDMLNNTTLTNQQLERQLEILNEHDFFKREELKLADQVQTLKDQMLLVDMDIQKANEAQWHTRKQLLEERKETLRLQIEILETQSEQRVIEQAFRDGQEKAQRLKEAMLAKQRAEAEAEKYGVAMEIGTDIMEGSYD